MKYFLILACLICVSVVAKEPSAKIDSPEKLSLKEKFIKETGLIEGEYALAKNSPEECASGPLEILEYKGEISVMYGARAFITGLGKDVLTEQYDDCTFSITSSYEGPVIKETSEEVCKKDGKAVVNTVLKVEKGNKIFYTRSLFTDDKPTKTITCSAKLQKAAKNPKKK